ncbi:MAG: hypothetical protein ACI9V1_002909 [Spirosomataceae bacterium]|jgi:hypothetical protein
MGTNAHFPIILPAVRATVTLIVIIIKGENNTFD